MSWDFNTNGIRSLGILIVSILWSSCVAAQGNARVAAVRSGTDPMSEFRRIEMKVAPDFSASCKTRRSDISCTVSEVPEDFPRLMVGLRGGTIARVDLIDGRRGKKIVRFKIRRPEISFQEKVLKHPSRWVVEFGLPEVLMGQVENMQPFRPYTIETSNISSKLPPANVFQLSPAQPENRLYNQSFEAWKGQRPYRAIELGKEAIALAPKSTAAKMAKKVIAESWVSLVEPDSTENLPPLRAALEAAEEVRSSPEEGARYALLTAQVLEAIGYLNRAELFLSNKAERYANSPAESYILAGHARILMRLGEGKSARRVLEKLRGLRGSAPTIGTALLALAELAYQEQNYVVSVGLFDSVKGRWPELLESNSSALFQAAELYMLYNRVDEAEYGYRAFLESPVKTAPVWLAKLRLAEILSYRDYAAATDAFREQAVSLGSSEGQNLAFLRYARLVDKQSERRRIIENLGALETTEYVFEELVVDAMQLVMERGDLDLAYRYGAGLWRSNPNAFILDKAPQVFERVLYMKVRRHLVSDDPLEVLRIYYDNKVRFESHSLRGEMHLMVGQAFRELAMFDEALTVLQNGVGGRTAVQEPDAAARIYRAMAVVLMENGDQYRLGEILEYLDSRYPKRFDDFDYWNARGHHEWWRGRLDEARKIFVYALNGDVRDDERLSLMGKTAEIYSDMGRAKPAIRALDALIKLHDSLGRPLQEESRRDARWRTAEINYQEGYWPEAVAALTTFIREYPDDSERFEARFLNGRALVAIGDEEGAKRQWDILQRSDPNGLYGGLAKMELDLLAWRQGDLNRTLRGMGM